MHLIDYLNNVKNPLDSLAQEPYCLSIARDGQYYLFKYTIGSNFDYQECIEARGCILKRTGDRWNYVCRPFTKFFNYGEKYAPNIHWASARASEKVDGSLMKIWYDEDKWHLSTNGTIDAYKAPVNDFKSFGQLFEEILGNSIQSLGDVLYKGDTYCFEMVSPFNKVVLNYEPSIYYLTSFDTNNGNEIELQLDYANIKHPKVYPIPKSLKDAVDLVSSLGADYEGIVVNDGLGQRIKIKTDEYIELHHKINNHNITIRHLIEMYKDETLDDFYSNFAEYRELIDKFKLAIQKILREMYVERAMAIQHISESGALYAQYVRNSKWSDYLFKIKKDLSLTPEVYLNMVRNSVLIEEIQQIWQTL